MQFEVMFDEMMAATVIDLLLEQARQVDNYLSDGGPASRVYHALAECLDTIKDERGAILWRVARINPENIQADDMDWACPPEDGFPCPNCGNETWGMTCPNCGVPGPLGSFLEDDGQPDEQQEWHDFDPGC
jgi:hypothetical protein